MRKLTTLYFVIAAIGVLIIGLVMVLQFQGADQDALLSIGEAQNERVGVHISRTYATNLEELPDELTELGIKRYTLIQDGIIAYSTDSEQIGQDFNENTESQRALRQQVSVSLQDGDQVTTYLPIENGLAEITSDLSSVDAILETRRGDNLTILLVAMVMLLAVLALFVSYARQNLEQQVAALEKQTSELMLQLVNRADFSHMSLLALQMAFRKLNAAVADASTLRGYQEIEGLAHNLALVEKMERFQLEPEKKPFGLDDLLRERAAHFKEAEVVLGVNSGLGLIADRAMMAHTIDAILHNINSHNIRQRAIKLSSSNSNGITRITAALPIVESVETLKRVNPNQHIDLTVARLMVERHGGNLEFNYSDGIQFHILLPSV